MALQKRGKYRYGDDQSDIRQEIEVQVQPGGK